MINNYDTGDSCFGTFTYGNEIILDNGERAFAHISLPYGTRVLCSIKRCRGRKNDIFVKIDSVYYDVA